MSVAKLKPTQPLNRVATETCAQYWSFSADLSSALELLEKLECIEFSGEATEQRANIKDLVLLGLNERLKVMNDTIEALCNAAEDDAESA